MVSDEQRQVAAAARAKYEQLRGELELTHSNDFVAIEPSSGEYFTGRTLTDAISAARAKYPDRLVHTIRVGHRAAVHFGLHIR